jgi:tetratricopeptide (TPR) repeat protein
MCPQQSTIIPPTQNPERFAFWAAAEGRSLLVGVDRARIPLPEVLLPINLSDLEDGEPSDIAIGQGLYDYLRQFPDCPNNRIYAELLQDAFPHFLTDLASQAVLLDAKEVETAHVKRKLNGLKILALVDRENAGLLLQLSRGFYELALSYEELTFCRRHLLQAMRYGQELLKISAENPYALHLLAEIDVLFGDFPGADVKWQRALAGAEDPEFQELVRTRRQAYIGRPWVESNLVDDLESLQRAIELYSSGNDLLALAILDRLEEEGRFAAELPSADYFYLLGICRHKNGESGGAAKAFARALEHDAQHVLTQEALAAIHGGVADDD